jgi:hypothetical protein
MVRAGFGKGTETAGADGSGLGGLDGFASSLRGFHMGIFPFSSASTDRKYSGSPPPISFGTAELLRPLNIANQPASGNAQGIPCLILRLF